MLHCQTQVEALPTPGELKGRLALDTVGAARIECQRRAIADVVHGREGRRLVVVGPCSAHDPDALREYADRVIALQERCRERLLLVLRCYVEKPRTLFGWRGMVADPDLDGGRDIAAGLERARGLLLGLVRLGLPVAAEVLDPLVAPYLADLLAWAAIGARTVESQVHRELAAALPLPVGCKNATDGAVEPAVRAVVAAGHPHRILSLDGSGRPVAMLAPGNPDAHLVLRGGGGRTNHGRASVAAARRLLRAHGLDRRVLVDCSHGNSGKDTSRQLAVARSVIDRLAAGETGIAGMMLEGHLVSGRQEPSDDPARLVYGCSVTDPCLGWEETETLLLDLARVA